MRKGVILVGGFGTRLYPIARSVSRQLLPIYGKPMTYCPVSTHMPVGTPDVLAISTPEEAPRFTQRLVEGNKWDFTSQYALRPSSDGLMRVFVIDRELVGNDPSTPGPRALFRPFGVVRG